MGIHAEMVNFDEEFAGLDIEAVVVNDFNTSIPEEKEALDRHLYTHYQGTDTIEESASCDCGSTTRVYNIGVRCTLCGTKVQSTTDRPVESMLWIRAPQGVLGLFSPEAWMVLEPAMRTKEFSFLEYLTNTDYRFDLEKIASKDTVRKINKLLANKIPRGWNNWVRHFDTTVEFLFNASIIDSTKVNKKELWAYIQENKHTFFPKHLPIPSRICFVVESTTSGVYIDNPLGSAMDAVLTIASIKSTPVKPTAAMVQNRVAKTIRELTRFYSEYTRTRLAKKPGMFRRHVFGSRLHFSGRAVITSISDPHLGHELHIPWGMATQLFKYHLINKLLKRGYDANEALAFVYSCVLQYHPVMDELFKELISEAEGMGPACVFQRN